MDKVLGINDVECEIRGKKYYIVPVKVGHLAKISSFYKNRFLRDAYSQRELLGLNAEQFKPLIENALAESKKYDMDPQALLNLMFGVKEEGQEEGQGGNLDLECVMYFISLRMKDSKGQAVPLSFIEDLEFSELAELIIMLGDGEKKEEGDGDSKNVEGVSQTPS